MKTPSAARELAARRCQPMEGQHAHDAAWIQAQLAELPGWQHRDGMLERGFSFRDYYETLAFVNALAWMVHGEDHHPELSVSYNRCTVRWNTHSVGGLSDNDFICAAKTDAIFARSGA